MTSKAEFDARVEAFGSLFEEHCRPPVCEDLLERYFRADEELELTYRELDAFAKSRGIDLNRRLAEEGFLELMWYKQPAPRPSVDVLEAWEARVGRVSLAELRLQNKNAKIVELNARFNHVMKHEKLAAIYMLEPGDSVEIGPEDGLIYFCDRDIGYFKTDVPNLREFIEDPRAYGIAGKVFAEVASVQRDSEQRWPSFTLHIYYAIDESQGRVRDGFLLSEDGKSLIRCVDDVADLTIPEGIERIEDGAFSNCSVSSIVFPKSLKHIGSRAFYGTCLKSVEVPSWIESIGLSPFAYSSRRNRASTYVMPEAPTYIEVGEGNERYCSWSGSLFERNDGGLALISYYYHFASVIPGRFVFRVPRGTTRLMEGYFLFPWGHGRDGVYKLVLPGSVVRVDEGALPSEVSITNCGSGLDSGRDAGSGGCPIGRFAFGEAVLRSGGDNIAELAPELAVKRLERAARSCGPEEIASLYDLFGDFEFQTGVLVAALKAGMAENAAALLKLGARLDNSCGGASPKGDTVERMQERIDRFYKKSAETLNLVDGREVGAVDKLLDSDAFSADDLKVLLLLAIRDGNSALAARLCEKGALDGEGCICLQKRSKKKPGKTANSPDGFLEVGVSPQVAKAACVADPQAISRCWDDRMANDVVLMNELVPYLREDIVSSCAEKLAVCLARGGDISSLKRVLSWPSALKERVLDLAIDAASAAGRTETLAFLLDAKSKAFEMSYSLFIGEEDW